MVVVSGTAVLAGMVVVSGAVVVGRMVVVWDAYVVGGTVVVSCTVVAGRSVVVLSEVEEGETVAHSAPIIISRIWKYPVAYKISLVSIKKAKIIWKRNYNTIKNLYVKLMRLK